MGLIAPDELARALAGEHPPVVVDARWTLGGPPGRDEYVRGHVPGAHYVDLDTELAGPPGFGGRHPLPDDAIAGAALRRCGVHGDSSVVVYDGRCGFSAARAWWVFRNVGLDDVRVLDGGFDAWVAAGLPVSSEVPWVDEGTFTPRPSRMPVLDAEGAARLAADGILLDARAPERYSGEVEPIDPVAGHIPGAVSAPTSENLAPDGTFLPPHELAARFAALGVTPGTCVGVYCGSGVTAAHQAFAMRLAGIDAAVYVGSWSEWVTDPDRPVARS